MKTIFVSGCYDVLHGGHIDFFKAARARGDRLIVSVASDEVYMRHKGRLASQGDTSKLDVLRALRIVDEVILGQAPELGFDFWPDFVGLAMEMKKGDQLELVAAEDDRYSAMKQTRVGLLNRNQRIKGPVGYFKMSGVKQRPISTTAIVAKLRAPVECPLRVDFGGGWLDMPRFARPGGFVVNCAITPMVSLSDWPYEEKCGLGGSAAWAFLHGKNPVESELSIGAGWQDGAAIRETGLCVWRSGPQPSLEFKTDGAFLQGLMALRWTGKRNMIVDIAGKERDYERIAEAGRQSREGVLAALRSSPAALGFFVAALQASYKGQRTEGMNLLPLVPRAIACKYCGGGFGGYALYLFEYRADRDRACKGKKEFLPIEPYCR